jgi:hypothetical protein
MLSRFVHNKVMVVLAVTLGLAILLLFIKAMSGSPVLFRVPDVHSGRGGPLLLVLNPLRNHEPERIADSFLEGLKNGQCVDLVSSFSREKAIEICEKQSRYPLVEWKLLDLAEENETYSFTYEHRSKNAVGLEEMRVWVKLHEQNWKIVDFVIGY